MASSPPGLDVVAVDTAVLVEGDSDRLAIEALAVRRDRDLRSEGVAVLSMGGATNIGRYLTMYGSGGAGLRLAGLCDVGEAEFFGRALQRAGMGLGISADMESNGFFICRADLEDELIRALGTKSVEQVIESQGDLGSFRTLRQQPAQRGREAGQQLRRFMGSGSGRKIRYAPLLVEALDLDQVPQPLDQLLAFV